MRRQGGVLTPPLALTHPDVSPRCIGGLPTGEGWGEGVPYGGAEESVTTCGSTVSGLAARLCGKASPFRNGNAPYQPPPRRLEGRACEPATRE
jgi:hypothetical protein